MAKIRFFIAFILAKLSKPALKITGHNGTDFPGALALRICPDFMIHIKKPAHIICITGTNGKTTVTNLITDLFTVLGRDVLSNSFGSNISSGIATAFLNGVSLTGASKYDTAVLEIDERSAKKLFRCFTPEILAVLNLSRDSIMRNAHPEYIKDFLTAAISPEVKLVINADDLIASKVAPDNERIYFGIDKMPGDKETAENIINDMRICPNCHGELKYRYVRYSNIGKAYCDKCGFSSPEYDCKAYDVNISIGSMSYSGMNECEEFALISNSVFNIYNQLAAITILQAIGYSAKTIKCALDKVKIADTRFACTEIGDVKIYRMLCKEKNAYAAARVFEYISELPGDKEILLFNNCIGDTKHWSENTCWLYDCDFEHLNDDKIKRIIVYGDRRYDYRLRMLLAGIGDDRIECIKNPHDGARSLNYFENDNIYVLYGTDSLALGLSVANEVEEEAMRRINNGRHEIK